MGCCIGVSTECHSDEGLKSKASVLKLFPLRYTIYQFIKLFL